MAVPTPRLAQFLDLLKQALRQDEAMLPHRLVPALEALVRTDDWLPQAYAVPGRHYRQYLLWRCPEGRASVVSFVWDKGQGTPVHDHGVWGLVGVLRGLEAEQHYRHGPHGLEAVGAEVAMAAGDVGVLVPGADLHAVRNLADGISVSIHVYGADIGTLARSTYAADGARSLFVSGYADAAAAPEFSY